MHVTSTFFHIHQEVYFLIIACLVYCTHCVFGSKILLICVIYIVSLQLLLTYLRYTSLFLFLSCSVKFYTNNIIHWLMNLLVYNFIYLFTLSDGTFTNPIVIPYGRPIVLKVLADSDSIAQVWIFACKLYGILSSAFLFLLFFQICKPHVSCSLSHL